MNVWLVLLVLPVTAYNWDMCASEYSEGIKQSYDYRPLEDSYTPGESGNWWPTALGVTGDVYPLGIHGMKMEGEDNQSRRWWTRQPYTFSALVNNLGTAVHEGSHYADWESRYMTPAGDNCNAPDWCQCFFRPTPEMDFILKVATERDVAPTSQWPRRADVADGVPVFMRTGNVYYTLYFTGHMGEQRVYGLLTEWVSYLHDAAVLLPFTAAGAFKGDFSSRVTSFPPASFLLLGALYIDQIKTLTPASWEHMSAGGPEDFANMGTLLLAAVDRSIWVMRVARQYDMWSGNVYEIMDELEEFDAKYSGPICELRAKMGCATSCVTIAQALGRSSKIRNSVNARNVTSSVSE